MHASTLKLGQKMGHILGQVRNKLSFRLAEPEIDRQFVASDIIVTLGYDAEKQCLQAEYYNGHLYRIDGVLPEMHHKLLNTDAFDHMFQNEVCADREMTCIGHLLPVFR